MKRKHFIGLDTHCQFTEVAVVTATGRLKFRVQCATTVWDILAVIQKAPKPRVVALEEGPLADWLWRNLQEHGEEVIVAEPRRNHLIAKDADKDDAIDAEKLANLVRGGYVKEVYHAESLERMIFKQHVQLYQDRLRRRVAEGNRLGAVFRRFGVFVREKGFATGEQRQKLLERLPASAVLRDNIHCLWRGYDVAAEQVQEMRERLRRLARQEEVIRRFVAVPGIQWIRAALFFVIVDTPERFRSKSALWRYVGLGLERRHSGSGRMRVQLSRRCNRQIKSALLGAARSAVASGNNPYAEHYRRWIETGCSATIALRNTARSLSATLWGMWKSGSAYRPQWVGAGLAGAPRTVASGRSS